MKVDRFSVPGCATRRRFAVYVVVAVDHGSRRKWLYVGKTGDNCDGCNPVISRAGNHFSYNSGHSQIRNRLGSRCATCTFEYFFLSLGYYGNGGNRKCVDRINELERMTNLRVQNELGTRRGVVLVNAYKGRHVSAQTKAERARLVAGRHKRAVRELVEEAMAYVDELK